MTALDGRLATGKPDWPRPCHTYIVVNELESSGRATPIRQRQSKFSITTTRGVPICFCPTGMRSTSFSVSLKAYITRSRSFYSQTPVRICEC
jgi:hypothetical protein